MPALIASKPKGSPISGHAYEMLRPIASTTGARHVVDLTRLRHDSTKAMTVPDSTFSTSDQQSFPSAVSQIQNVASPRRVTDTGSAGLLSNLKREILELLRSISILDRP